MIKSKREELKQQQINEPTFLDKGRGVQNNMNRKIMEKWNGLQDGQALVKLVAKKKYVAPRVRVTFFEFEDCIAAASAQIVVDPNSGPGPEVEDWQVKEDEHTWTF